MGGERPARGRALARLRRGPLPQAPRRPARGFLELVVQLALLTGVRVARVSASPGEGLRVSTLGG